MVDESETLGGSLEDVRAFCAVAELGTVSAASRHLGETKGSISRRLSRLESRLGVRLLARTPRAVTPTEEGIAFFAKAREALTWLDDAVEGARQSQELPRGHLRVTAPVDLGMDVLPELVVQFRVRHPQITVELLLTDAALDLAANRVDLALRASVGDLPDMTYRASVLTQLRIGLYAAPTYVATHAGLDTPSDLSEHDFVLPQEFTSTTQLQLTDHRGRAQNVLARAAIRTSDYASVLRLTAAGGGIGPIPDLVAAPALALGTLVPILPEWSIAIGTLYAISLSGRDAPARVRAFRDFMRAALEDSKKTMAR